MNTGNGRWQKLRRIKFSRIKNTNNKTWSWQNGRKNKQWKNQKTSRGMRKHVRRMKQESRKAGIPINELKKKVRLTQVSEKEA
jgi:hypothetical protein